MKRLIVFSIVATLILSAYYYAPTLKITSSAFPENGNIPSKFTCEGDQVNPPLHISGVPEGTKSLALVINDPDASLDGGFNHWVVWNIDPSVREIPEGFDGAVQGFNSAKKAGYIGMCPPSGTHHYHFIIYALDTRLDIKKYSDKEVLEKSMEGHVIARNELIGLYKNNKS
ncbi:MAG: YbhB/YbcL family Raf kinase inhibitor-like protein [Ginsengibacter sp.]